MFDKYLKKLSDIPIDNLKRTDKVVSYIGAVGIITRVDYLSGAISISWMRYNTASKILHKNCNNIYLNA